MLNRTSPISTNMLLKPSYPYNRVIAGLFCHQLTLNNTEKKFLVSSCHEKEEKLTKYVQHLENPIFKIVTYKEEKNREQQGRFIKPHTNGAESYNAVIKKGDFVTDLFPWKSLLFPWKSL